MSNIKYIKPADIKPLQSGAAQVIREAMAGYQADQMSVLAEGFNDFVKTQQLFDDYVQQLSEGLDADAAENFAQLAKNGNMVLQHESMMGGIAPISSLNLPILRTLLPRLCMKNTLRNQVVESPEFTITSLKGYLVDSDGNEYAIPGAWKQLSPDGRRSVNLQLKFGMGAATSGAVTTTGLAAVYTEELTGMTFASQQAVAPSSNLVDVANGSKAARDYLDNDVSLYVEFNDGAATPFIMTSKVQDFDASASTSVVNFSATTAQLTTAGSTVTLPFDITVMAVVDRREGHIKVTVLDNTGTFAAVAANVTVNVVAHLATTNNLHAPEVKFKNTLTEVHIGSGENLAAPMNFQVLQDMKAMFNIDGAIKLSDMLGRAMAEKIDKIIYEYIKGLHNKNKSFGSQFKAYEATFDCKPAGAVLQSQQDWLNNLKQTIDVMVAQMMQDTYMSNCKVVIFGKPLSTRLIINSGWTNALETSGEVGGVNVNYGMGSFAGGSGFYTVLNSAILPDDNVLYLTIIPNEDDIITYNHYDYSFNVITDNSYRNPNQPNIPGILMNSRFKQIEIMPLMGKINLLNNDLSQFGSFDRRTTNVHLIP